MNIPAQHILKGIKNNSCIAFMFAYSQKNVERMISYCNPGGSIYFEPLGDEGRGTIGVLGKQMFNAFTESFPDMNSMLYTAIKENEHTVRCVATARGTQHKPFAGIPSKGRRFYSDYILIFKLDRNKKINSINISWDHHELKAQLGS